MMLREVGGGGGGRVDRHAWSNLLYRKHSNTSVSRLNDFAFTSSNKK